MPAHRFQPDVAQPVDEHPDMRGADLTCQCGLACQGEIAQHDRAPDQGVGLPGVHPQLGAHPRIQGRGAVELEVLGRIEVGQEYRLRSIESVLRSLDRVQLAPHITGGKRSRGGAHRVHHSPRVHTPNLVERMFDRQEQTTETTGKNVCQSRVQ